MNVYFSRSAVKFLDKATAKEKERIRQKIKALVLSIEEHAIIPFKEMDIKKLSGEWNEYFRLRMGKTRIIFKIDRNKDRLSIYSIDFRRTPISVHESTCFMSTIVRSAL